MSREMSLRSSWDWTIRRPSRRFTTLSGWREIGTGIYATGPSMRTFSIQHQFDVDRYQDDRTSWTRPSRSAVDRDPLATVFGHEKENDVKDIMGQIGERTEIQDVESGKEKAYHVFGKSEIRGVVLMIGVAGLFSGLSSNIYFPALDAVATDLNVSSSLVSLTITSYLIIQGISPLLWGSLSDTVGRRPVYIASFLVYILANVALSFSPNFAVLLAFRGIQAAGSASTVSIGNGVIQDIVPSAERGGYISFYQGIRNFSIAAGPVLGGILSNFLGFRSIFVFLLILSALNLLFLMFFLPETLRSIAGNGSLRLTGVHQPIAQKLTRKTPAYVTEEGVERSMRPKVTFKTFIEPLFLLTEKDILLSLVFGGVVYTIWSMVTASTTSLFKADFQLNEIALGLAFIPNGLGTILGSYVVGNLLDRSYKATLATYRETHSLPKSFQFSKKDIPTDFPIEQARMKYLGWVVVIFVVATAGFGFSVERSFGVVKNAGWICIPLLLQFLVAAASNAVFAINQTLVSDLCPGKGASSTAINNLVRCSLGAVGVAFIEQMLAATGPSATFVALALVAIAMTPLAVVQWYWGAQWRAERMDRKERVKQDGRDGRVA